MQRNVATLSVIFLDKTLLPTNIGYSDTSSWVWRGPEAMTQGHWRPVLLIIYYYQSSELNMFITVHLKFKCKSTQLIQKYIGRQCSLSSKIVFVVFCKNFPVGICSIWARKDKRKKVLSIFF